MKLLFVDTAGWMMLADSAEPRHGAAVAARDNWLLARGALLTTDYVADETLTLLRARTGIASAESWWNGVSASPRVRWECIDPRRADAARTLFFGWRDKAFSFTDCTSFVVMRELGIRSALTSDHHFAQAGFDVLPATT